jgi:hypothetical protein
MSYYKSYDTAKTRRYHFLLEAFAILFLTPDTSMVAPSSFPFLLSSSFLGSSSTPDSAIVTSSLL